MDGGEAAGRPARARLEGLVPVLSWGRNYQRRDLRHDLTAGLTVGAMLVPQAMAYAQLAGLPPQVGLYSVTLPLVAYALLGSSRQLAVGPVAVVSLLTASALAPLAAQGTGAYLGAAALLAVMVGAGNLVLAVARMGWVTNLLSHPVLVGYTAAAALIIGASQLKHLLGVSIPRTEAFGSTLWELAGQVGSVQGVTVAIGMAALVALVAMKRWRRTFPGALVVVMAGVVVSVVLGLDARGVAVVGEIPSGLPTFAVPTVSVELLWRLAPAALTITLVGYMESIAVARVYARRNRYDIDPNQEFVALGTANVVAGFVGGQPVTGGFSRTAVNADAGARTPLASVVSAGVIAAVLVVATSVFEPLPQAVLAAVVLAAVAGLFDGREMRHIARVKRSDAATMAVAFVATLALGVEWGIAVAVAASIAVLVARVMNPHSAEVGRLPGSEAFRNLERFPEARRQPHVGILRIDVSLNFANVTFLKRRLRRLEAAHPEGLRAIVLDGAGINDLDASAAAALADLVAEYDQRAITIHLADMKGPVRDVLMRSGLWDVMPGRIHPSVHAAVTAIAGGCPVAYPDPRLVGLDERPCAGPDPDPTAAAVTVPDHQENQP